MPLKFIEHLIGLGTRPQNDFKQNQIIRLINAICFFVILVITPYMFLTLYFRFMSATVVQLVAIMALGLMVFLNAQHYFNLARALTLLIGNIHIFNMVLILGLKSGIHYYFSAAIIAPLFFYTSKELKHILSFVALTTLLALLIQSLGANLGPFIEIPDVLLTFFFYFSFLCSLITVFVFVYYFYNESNRYEKSLKATNKKLLIELTEKEAAQEALRINVKKYRDIVEGFHEGHFFYSHDRNRNFTYLSPSVSKVLGYLPEEKVGQKTPLTDNPINREAEKFTSLCMEGHAQPAYLVEVPHKDGSTRLLEVSEVPVFDEEGNVTAVEGIAHDVTNRERMDNDLRHAKEAAEASNRAKSVFLANMSHELRTPLNSIIGFSQIIARNPDIPVAEQNNLSIIQRNGEHLLTLINQVLDLSKIEAGRITLDEDDFDLYRLVEELKSMFTIKMNTKSLTLLFDLSPGVPRHVYGDKVKLRQVLINLLSNAIKFTQEGSVELRISLKEHRGAEDTKQSRDLSGPSPLSDEYSIEFKIKDTGPGIEPDEMDHVFEDFRQTASGKDAQEGTGLGLSLSRKFVQLMGGDLLIESEVGRGTTFTFYIEVQEASAAGKAQAAPTRRVVALQPGQPRYRMLVVDDSEDSRKLLVTLLGPMGFELREATNGQEAVEIWEDWRPHLIWMDIRMPVMDGLEATERVRTQPSSIPRPVIVAVTASVLEGKQPEVLSSGCDDFIPKPFTEADIFEMIQKHLGVRFVYEEDTQSTSFNRQSTLESALTPEALSALPVQWLDTLRQGARRADFLLLARVIDLIRGQDEALAGALAMLAEDFKYDEILAMLPQTGQDTQS